ncbi:uncharacterized protein EAF02_000452 [Botrytis sinoallii]|uniref:uncharacterized protein n=1 Tax=Botrytis sinoallii TaxID=1463999 RepID=UPI0019023ABC|nr:uncharacterized protein EAF02_000452 [Botrytis sinoallii]KAF7892914.1 hypothetical protein EAF02_000452 [Botrytis sinoallii]
MSRERMSHPESYSADNVGLNTRRTDLLLRVSIRIPFYFYELKSMKADKVGVMRYGRLHSKVGVLRLKQAIGHRRIRWAAFFPGSVLGKRRYAKKEPLK